MSIDAEIGTQLSTILVPFFCLYIAVTVFLIKSKALAYIIPKTSVYRYTGLKLIYFEIYKKYVKNTFFNPFLRADIMNLPTHNFLQ